MLKACIYKEWLTYRRDGRLRTVLALWLILVIGVSISGYQQFRVHAQAQTSAQTHEHERWLGQGEKNPHSAAHYGVYAFRPLASLAYFEPGLTPYQGVTLRMEAHKQDQPLYRPADSGDLLALFPSLSASTLIGLILPLLIFALVAPMVSAERESGVLRQLLAQGVASRKLLWGKALAAFSLVACLLGPVLIFFAVLVMTQEGTDDAFLRWLLLTVVTLIFAAAMVLLAIAVSALARTERSALGILLVFWFVTTMAAPRVAAEWAQLQYPVPDSHSFRNQMTEALRDEQAVQARLAQSTQALLQEYGMSDPDGLPVNLDGVRLREADRHGYAVFDEFYGALFDTYQAQERSVMRTGQWLPYLAWGGLASAFSGTDYLHFRDFLQHAETYRRSIQNLMSSAIINNAVAESAAFMADESLWSEVPMFHYHYPSIESVFVHYRSAFFALCLWLLAMLALLEFAARRLTRGVL